MCWWPQCLACYVTVILHASVGCSLFHSGSALTWCLQKALYSFVEACFPLMTAVKDGPCGVGVPHIQAYCLGHPAVTPAVYSSLSPEVNSLKSRMASYFSECPLSLS